MTVAPELLQILRCPESGERLAPAGPNALTSESGRIFPVVEGVPILLSEYWTPFDHSQAVKLETSGFSPKLLRTFGRWLPPLDRNLGARKAFEAFFNSSAQGGHCLVIGAGDNPGTNAQLAKHFSKVTVTDIVKGPGTSVVCDAHALPFADDTFDAVVIIAVLEHVLSPERVVGRITDVLKEGGVIYADTAFMQQVHMGQFDFTRFTDLGHRWLFRCYDEILRSNAAGPGAALAWAINYLLLSFVGKRRAARLAVRSLVRLFFFWVHWLDYLLQSRPAARDAGSGVIFVGRNRKSPTIEPRQLVAEYRGGF
jgi:SAM-dependent methyltransferase